MSRDLSNDDRDCAEGDDQRDPASRMALSQGRGGSGSDEDHRKRASDEELTTIRERIDRFAQGHPPVTEFISRLAEQGVRAIPSMQSDGRWNGVVYELGNVQVKGSALGRSYTAQGLQQRKGIRYEPARDRDALMKLAGQERPLRSAAPDAREPQRADRTRSLDGLNPNQRQTLWDVGRFRTIATVDLSAARYGGRNNLVERDVKHLVKEGLIEQRTVPTNSRGATLSVLTLTRKGRDIIRRSMTAESGQAIYHGFVKPREVVHDATLYKMFQAEAVRIERNGGRVRRVVLDYELKKRAYSPLAKARDLTPLAYAERQQEIAQETGLQIVDGRLVLPDVRVEYETAEGEELHIDLELVTANYRAAHVRGKAAAGFRVYAQAKGGHLAAVLDKHDLVAEILG
jgi:DNA-binding MarR family transcriptional regulator